MLESISYYLIFGKPVIMYSGVITLISFIATALMGMQVLRGKGFPFKLHMWAAATSLVFAAIHGALGLLLYF